MENTIKQLTAELAEANVRLNSVFDIREWQKEVEALKVDAERLDWLGTHDNRFYNIDRITSIVGHGFNSHQDLRYAIDAARGEK